MTEKKREDSEIDLSLIMIGITTQSHYTSSDFLELLTSFF